MQLMSYYEIKIIRFWLRECSHDTLRNKFYSFILTKPLCYVQYTSQSRNEVYTDQN